MHQIRDQQIPSPSLCTPCLSTVRLSKFLSWSGKGLGIDSWPESMNPSSSRWLWPNTTALGGHGRCLYGVDGGYRVWCKQKCRWREGPSKKVHRLGANLPYQTSLIDWFSFPPQGLQRVHHTVVCISLEVPTVLWFDQTARAATFLVAAHQTLLWKVSNVCSKDQMDSTHASVSANHLLSLMTSIGQRTQQQGHCIVEKTMSCVRLGLLLETLELRHR